MPRSQSSLDFTKGRLLAFPIGPHLTGNPAFHCAVSRLFLCAYSAKLMKSPCATAAAESQGAEASSAQRPPRDTSNPRSTPSEGPGPPCASPGGRRHPTAPWGPDSLDGGARPPRDGSGESPSHKPDSPNPLFTSVGSCSANQPLRKEACRSRKQHQQDLCGLRLRRQRLLKPCRCWVRQDQPARSPAAVTRNTRSAVHFKHRRAAWLLSDPGGTPICKSKATAYMLV
ncbi:hypothetical protein QF036_002352 [Arthrobacter globiformis]|nr:hypothetical protein [Arthrobacter globiformis]